MPFDVRLTPEAARQLQDAVAWWFTNRQSAPDLLLAELERVFALLAKEPGIGKLIEDPEFAEVRRVHAGRVRYHVYYRVRGQLVEVVAVWDANRGEGPSLSTPG